MTLTQLVNEVGANETPDMENLRREAIKAAKRYIVAIGDENGVTRHIYPNDYDPRYDGGKEYGLGQ